MKERPILFSGAMVRAILDGRKTQTRRVLKPQPTAGLDGWDWSWPIPGKNVTPGTRDYWRNDAKNPLSSRYCPYGQPGHRLWVRETWYCDDYRVQRGPYLKPDDMDADEAREHGTLVYAADGLRPYEAEQPVWRPSIHMPRWASRIALEITGVRVERLNDCGEDDAIAEGIERDGDGWLSYAGGSCVQFPTTSYASLWDSINGRDAWDANPWVWVVEFIRV